ncbi:MAG: hypothetical protein JKX94_01145 [Sneathiella sp.]|nr:hypothetical protein [Sneathiella sp.]
MNKIQSLPPIFVTLLIQFIVYICLSFLRPELHDYLGYVLPLFWLMLVQGALSASITFLLRLPYWWVCIQVVAPPLLVLGMALDLPLWVFPVLLALLLMIFWNVVINRVPLYLTNNLTVDKLDDLLPKKAGLKVVDLGSGFGGTMRQLASKRSKQHFYGYETAPIPFLLSWLLAKLDRRSHTEFYFKSFWAIDLGKYDVVYCFLSPVPMPDLYAKAVGEMKPGSLFISNSFTVPNHKPNRTVTVHDARHTKLMIWKI